MFFWPDTEYILLHQNLYSSGVFADKLKQSSVHVIGGRENGFTPKDLPPRPLAETEMLTPTYNSEKDQYSSFIWGEGGFFFRQPFL